MREAIFISHASPEDNVFTLWLGAKLTNMGFEVWADVLSLQGGDDWQRKLEDAIRFRACKVLLVANEISVGKQGVRNEIQIASDTGRRIGDGEFIIPLRLRNFDAPFLIAHAQYIDFSSSWAKGLVELLEVLEERAVPRSSQPNHEMWKSRQLLNAQSVARTPEPVVSNWFALKTAPTAMSLFVPGTGVSAGRIIVATEQSRIPFRSYGDGYLTFARQESVQVAFDFPMRRRAVLATSEFINEGWPEQNIRRGDARNIANHLLRAGLEKAIEARGCAAAQMANDNRAWYFPLAENLRNQVVFDWGRGLSGRRQIIGHSEKREVWWHYGISPQVVMNPTPHLKLRGRLVFTSDGNTPLDSTSRMHRLRRSFPKAWRNARWRDMLLAFMWHLTEGNPDWRVPFGENSEAVFSSVPLVFEAPISMAHGDSDPDDVDDPDIEDNQEPCDKDAI
ncbi:MAG: toll/interleukin-1 receptor domain-containing protein [Hyphomicrobiales bacterium]|nr:toll/interleukin-1 receptor domain-containing protein [Hyphomicrobiales bacterium]